MVAVLVFLEFGKKIVGEEFKKVKVLYSDYVFIDWVMTTQRKMLFKNKKDFTQHSGVFSQLL